MKLPWARILLAAFVVELLFAAYVFLVLGSSDAAFSPPGRMGAFGFMLAGGLWVGSRAQWNAIPQGILVGVAAHLFYLLIVLIVWVVVATDIPLPPPGSRTESRLEGTRRRCRGLGWTQVVRSSHKPGHCGPHEQRT